MYRQTSTDELLQTASTDELIEEIGRYLDTVAVFRALGHEPKWRSEPGSEGPVIALITPFIDRVSPV